MQLAALCWPFVAASTQLLAIRIFFPLHIYIFLCCVTVSDLFMATLSSTITLDQQVRENCASYSKMRHIFVRRLSGLWNLSFTFLHYYFVLEGLEEFWVLDFHLQTYICISFYEQRTPVEGLVLCQRVPL